MLEERLRVQDVVLERALDRARERRASGSDVRGRGGAPRDRTLRAVVDRKRVLDDELCARGHATPVLGRTEALGHGPDGLGVLPALHEAAVGELVHARADVLEHALAVVATAVTEVGRYGRALPLIVSELV